MLLQSSTRSPVLNAEGTNRKTVEPDRFRIDADQLNGAECSEAIGARGRRRLMQ